jgi:hypothetical protein
MATTTNNSQLPNGYVRLEGSEKHPSRGTRLLGPADDKETLKVTIVLRRRPDGPPLPDFDYYAKTPPAKRQRMPAEEFAAKYGADPNDIKQVVKFAEGAGLKVVNTHLGRRTVEVTGTVAQMSKAFALTLGSYEYSTIQDRRKPVPVKKTYRGRDGWINVPRDLASLMVGVFGLDNRPVGHRGGVLGDPPITNPLSMQQITSAYNFPGVGATIQQQTIGVIAPTGGTGGYFEQDLAAYFTSLGISPKVVPISVDGYNNGNFIIATSTNAAAGGNALTFIGSGAVAQIFQDMTVYPATGMPQYDASNNILYYSVKSVVTAGPIVTVLLDTYNAGTQASGPAVFAAGGVPAGTPIYFDSNANNTGETNQDICIAAGAAPGANVAVYFSVNTEGGWVDLIKRVIEPDAGDFPPGVNPPTVLSASWSIAPGDDPVGLTYADNFWQTGITTGGITAMTQVFQDAALFAVTVCIDTYDYGANSGVEDVYGYAHVVYPASDPWVLAVGGTTLGHYLPTGSTTPEWVEYVWNDPSPIWGTGGGGVSDFFPVPSYQNGAGIPDSINLTIAGPYTFNKTGRGIPDVAANASINSGFSGLTVGGVPALSPGNGTSASTPFWAGLIALLNSNLGYNLGFVNPILYTLGPGNFNPINPLWPDPAYPQLVLPPPAGCPSWNGSDGYLGYPAGPGWDACTGLGSPNGSALLASFQALGKAYVYGGYQSADIIITNLTTSTTGTAGTPVPLGGTPSTTTWDTLLVPNLPYGFQATIHNGSSVDEAYIDSVSFWAVPGGLGTAGGTLLATFSPATTIPPGGSITVPDSYSNIQFVNPGSHMCAVISIFSESSGCSFNGAPNPSTGTDPLSQNIPDPGATNSHSCSAWRNTDTMSAMSGGMFKFKLGFNEIPVGEPITKPIELEIHSTHIPYSWNKDPKIRQVQAILDLAGAKSNVPLYLLPEFIHQFERTSGKNKVTAIQGGKVEERDGKWHITPEPRAKATSFEISGQIPKTAKRGDVILVNVTANYPKIGELEARSVGFLEFIYVTEE